MHVSGIPYQAQTSSVILRTWVRDEANEMLMLRFRDGDPRAFELWWNDIRGRFFSSSCDRLEPKPSQKS